MKIYLFDRILKLKRCFMHILVTPKMKSYLHTYLSKVYFTFFSTPVSFAILKKGKHIERFLLDQRAKRNRKKLKIMRDKRKIL